MVWKVLPMAIGGRVQINKLHGYRFQNHIRRVIDMLSIDEAIAHAREVAKENREKPISTIQEEIAEQLKAGNSNGS